VLDPFRLVTLILFIALIHIVCCLKIYLHQTMQTLMVFAYILKMFQDKCNRNCDRDYVQCNRSRLQCDFGDFGYS